MRAVTKDPMALQWADPTLQGDREVAVAALEGDYRAVEWVGKNLMADKTVSGYAPKKPRSARRPSSSGATARKSSLRRLPSIIKLAEVPNRAERIPEIYSRRFSPKRPTRPTSYGAQRGAARPCLMP